MASTKTKPPTRRPPARNAAAPRRRSLRWVWLLGGSLLVLGVLFAIFRSNNASSGGGHGSGHGGYQIGSPGIGAQAPGFDLPASTGGSISLQSLRGKTVLLYFQEGVGCEPCWTQMKDLESAASQVKAAGVDEIVSVTTQPVNLLTQKAHDEGVHMPVLSDTSLAVSKAYHANLYGMMGDSMDGHSFILVAPDGTIEWRADYGGAPKYTMYVPVKQLLSDLAAGRRT